ncbi:MAG: hypothetical protein P1U53_10240 [Sulfitobacter sp.]|nr:hypothetical protein [Sulfitobacter sp.]
MIEVFRAAMVSSIVCAATGALAATDVDAMAMGVNVSFDPESNSVAFENDSTCNIQGYVVEFDMVLESASRFERERALAGPFQKNYVIVWSDLMTLAQYKLHNRTFGVTSNFRIVPNGYRASELQITRVSAIGSVPATFFGTEPPLQTGGLRSGAANWVVTGTLETPELAALEERHAVNGQVWEMDGAEAELMKARC